MKFIVQGFFYGALASLNCEAVSEEAAIKRFHDHFGEKVKGFRVDCIEAKDQFEEYWHHDGWAHFWDGNDHIREI